MTTTNDTTIEERLVMGGGTVQIQVRRTQNHKGVKLGSSLKSDWDLVEVPVEHIERETERAFCFDGAWIAKSIIEALVWETHMGVEIVAKIVIPDWLANREFN